MLVRPSRADPSVVLDDLLDLIVNAQLAGFPAAVIKLLLSAVSTFAVGGPSEPAWLWLGIEGAIRCCVDSASRVRSYRATR